LNDQEALDLVQASAMRGHEPKHGYFLTVGPDPKGRGWLAVLSDGTPQLGHTDIEVLTLEILPTRKAAKKWFRECVITKPWIPRS
jgi:hypothetical protein